MVRNCVDCDRFQINIILSSEDMEVFRHYLFESYEQDFGYWLPGVRLVEYEKMEFKHYPADVDVAKITKGLHKTMYQDFKKNHGCLVTGKKHCSLLDSEGTIMKTTWYADIVREYLDAPFVIHNSQYQNGTYRTIPCKSSTPHHSPHQTRPI